MTSVPMLSLLAGATVAAANSRRAVLPPTARNHDRSAPRRLSRTQNGDTLCRSDRPLMIAREVIACLGDPALAAAREVAKGPVIGIAEAAMHAASFISVGFSIVTTLPRGRGHIEHLVRSYGMAERCRSIRPTNLAVLDLESKDS